MAVQEEQKTSSISWSAMSMLKSRCLMLRMRTKQHKRTTEKQEMTKRHSHKTKGEQARMTESNEHERKKQGNWQQNHPRDKQEANSKRGWSHRVDRRKARTSGLGPQEQSGRRPVSNRDSNQNRSNSRTSAIRDERA